MQSVLSREFKRIRLARRSDLAAVIACEKLAFQMPARVGHQENASQIVALEHQIREGAIHVIGGAARILGCISFLPVFDHIFVSTISVPPENQRNGIGSELLAFAEQSARRDGLRSVNLFTDGRNPGNIAFYRRRGYTETGRCDDNDFSRVFYRKTVVTN